LIINHKYKFCFFQIPRTGSTAIAKVLVEHYGSEQRDHKHSNYEHFLLTANNDEKSYFKFAGIRNPLDSILSQYLKMKNDKDGKFSRGTFGSGKPLSKGAISKYQFIKRNNATFEDFFVEYISKDFYKPHQEVTIDNMDFIIRFEELQEDFNQLMNMLDIPSIEIPVTNATKNRNTEFVQHYKDEMIPLAINTLTPVMKKYNFDFPEEWN